MEKFTETEKEQEILRSVVKEELDFISYVDVDTEKFHTIVTNHESDGVPPLVGTFSEEVEKIVTQYVHPGDRDHCMQHFALPYIKKELERRDSMCVSFRLLCGSHYRRKEMNIYYYEGKKETLVFVRRDVTESYASERQQKDRLYRALMDARHANQEKNEFLSRMSHEIRTPMNSIIGLSYLSRENIAYPKQVLENLDKIDMSARFLLSFIDDILNLSQIESGNIALNLEDTDFGQFLSNLKKVTEQKAGEKQICFTMEQKGNIEEKYKFDSEKLGKALRNILENAIKFTQPEGKIDFIIEQIAEKEEETTFRFTIQDNGIGMDKDFLPYAFLPFEQEDNGSTTLYGGTGLGLAIAQNIIDIMNGRIEVGSEKGNGSTFTVTVSLDKSENFGGNTRRHDQSENQDYDFSGKRVLLVEDNEISIEITGNILKHKNFMVDVAVNGREGVSKFLTHEPGYYDVILMDIRMPEMDGLTAAKKIRAAHHADSSRIPIVAMTANAFEEDVRKSFEAGMDAHLNKPVDIKQMYSVLDGIIFG